ncbi:Cytidine deaminase [Actinomyces bovis]|uniref:Cytidine deaminase n=1 Tax=Actinomyces bovis TaxID=1658 RepID=A0ABY1VKV4_9ACTO|nr:cytidine deaminase [Actinomyces bovis]SPT52720.1 Cytidine deaminase [Actinomyces bovis]VEG54684.1 Cytidine deaminase [Actinomyces israelii]
MQIPWEELTATAVAAMRKAYCPYSGYPVGAAGLTEDGRVVSGCNVENASYGCVLCAECGMVSQLAMTGGGRLVAVACVNGNEEPVVPCGRCRQLIFEHGGNQCQVLMPSGVMPMSQVMPGGFGPTELEAVPTSAYSNH